MTISDTINVKIIEAMKTKDQFSLDTFRMVKTALQNAAIAKEGHTLTNDDETSLLQKEIKKRHDAAVMYTDGGRPELADKEKREAELLVQLLPAQMSDADVEVAIKEAIAKSGATTKQDIGRVMSIVKPQLSGSAEPSRISSIALRLLS